MKSFAAVLIAVAGVSLCTLPASAQTLIVVPGGAVDYDTSPEPFSGDGYVYGRGFDPGQNFDPAAAAINALNISHFYPPRGRSALNVDRAVTLNSTGDSIAAHQLRCQAAYASYDLGSGTYIDGDGIPRPCRL